MANKVIHKRSIQKGLLPSGTTLDYGEIAVNYNSGEPFLSIRTTESGKTDTKYAKFIDEGTIDAKIKNVENQNAFSKVAVSGQTTIEADSATDTLTFAAGSNISITTDASNDKITIAATGLSQSGHNHDDRYYTESEINALLDNKSDTGHTHDGVLKNIELFLVSEPTEEFFADIQNTDTAIKEWKESGERRNVLFKVTTNNVDLPIGIVNAEGTYTFEEAKNNLMTFVNFQNQMYYQLGILSFSEMGATSEQMGLPSGIEYVCVYNGHNPLTETISYGNDFFVDPQFKSLHISLSSPNIKQIINTTPSVQHITYENLVHFRDNGQLVAGMQYRITDYETTTTQANTRSAGHPFDVVVLALSESTLAEEAYAVHSDRDTTGYFQRCDLSAWKLWYSLDNDTQRFTWADTQNGKGVIYRMIDEFNNDIPYDFKNIQFARYGLNIPEYNDAFTPVEKAIYDMVKAEMESENGEAFVYAGLDEDGKIWESDEERVVSTASGRVAWCYTFNDIRVNPTDGYDQSRASINGITNNYMELYPTRYDAKYRLPNNVFLMEVSCDNHFSLEVTNNTFMFVQRADITRFNYNVTSIRFTDAKLRMVNYSAFASNVIDLKAERCSQLFLGEGCDRNEFGANCYNIVLGKNSNNNTFGKDCINIVMGAGSSRNTFGKGCADNLLSNVGECVFGIECYENDFSKALYIIGCVFGNYTSNNTCAADTMITGVVTLEEFCDNSLSGEIDACSFGKGCHHNTFDTLLMCTFGSRAWGNKVGTLVRSTFLEECHHNTVGQECSEITFGNYSYGNTIGDSCRNITFENGANMNAIRVGNTNSAGVRHLCRNICFEEGVSGVVLYNSQDALSEDQGALKNIVVKRGIESTSPVFIEVEADRNYETSVAKNSKGEIKVYCEADLIS